MIECPICHVVNDDQAFFCSECGQRFSSASQSSGFPQQPGQGQWGSGAQPQQGQTSPQAQPFGAAHTPPPPMQQAAVAPQSQQPAQQQQAPQPQQFQQQQQAHTLTLVDNRSIQGRHL